jgi:hypothetical protein
MFFKVILEGNILVSVILFKKAICIVLIIIHKV